MQKRGRKQKTMLDLLRGLCVTAAVLAGILCALALLVRSGTLSTERLHPALLLGCLLSATAGCIVCRSGEGRMLAQLLSGTVPSFLLLCCGMVAGGSGGVGRRALWNAAALLIPCLVAQLFRGRKRQRRRR